MAPTLNSKMVKGTRPTPFLCGSPAAVCSGWTHDGRQIDTHALDHHDIWRAGAKHIDESFCSACDMDQESREYRGACPQRCPPRHAAHSVSHTRFRCTRFEKSSTLIDDKNRIEALSLSSRALRTRMELGHSNRTSAWAIRPVS